MSNTTIWLLTTTVLWLFLPLVSSHARLKESIRYWSDRSRDLHSCLLQAQKIQPVDVQVRYVPCPGREVLRLTGMEGGFKTTVLRLESMGIHFAVSSYDMACLPMMGIAEEAAAVMTRGLAEEIYKRLKREVLP